MRPTAASGAQHTNSRSIFTPFLTSSPARSYSLGTDSEVGSAWTRAHSQMMSDGNQAQGYTPSEFVSLSRSFWPGSARLSVAMWSGDIEPTFESLAPQVGGEGDGR